MIFNYLNEEETKTLSPLIPEDVLEGELKVVSVSEEEGLRGFAVIACDTDDLARLTWLYVLEDYRQKGYATALVHYLVEQLEGNEGCAISANYESDLEETAILDRIFAGEAFDITSDNLVVYQATRDQILDSPLLKGQIAVEAAKVAGALYPLEEVDLDVLEDFLERNPECPVSDYEIANSDGILSLAYGVDGNMTGLMLVSELDDDGAYIITNIYYSDKENPYLLVDFIQKAMIYIVGADDLVSRLGFSVETEEQAKLLTILFGEELEQDHLSVNTAIIEA